MRCLHHECMDSFCRGAFASLQMRQCDQKQMKQNEGEKRKQAEVLIKGGVRRGESGGEKEGGGTV